MIDRRSRAEKAGSKPPPYIFLWLLFCACVPVESGELCDDDVDNDGNGLIDCADTKCILAPACQSCGNGVVDEFEACDDGNIEDGDGCSANCLLESCGDGVVDPGEQCDDGNVNDQGPCDFACRINRCGDFVVQRPAEECDDGNRRDGDGCSARCRLETGAATCGDGVVQFQNGEECDDGNRNDNDGCSSRCRFERCGDFVVQPRLGEECDPPSAVCDGFCRRIRCGDGVLDRGEECDDGNRRDGDGCNADCRIERCGDGVRSPNEQCDDGNLAPNDGCSPECRFEVCGDGVRQAQLGELCDGEPECDARCRLASVCTDFDGEARGCFDIAEATSSAQASIVRIEQRGAAPARAWLGGTVFTVAQSFEVRGRSLVPVSVPLPRTPFLVVPANLSGDARDELVVGTFDGTLSIFDNALREVHVTFAGALVVDIDVGPLGGAGDADVVAVTNQRRLMMVIDPFGARQSLDVGLPRGASSVLVAPVADGAATAVYGSDQTLVVVRRAGGGIVEDGTLRLAGRIAELVRADVDDDGRDDIVALTLGPDRLVAVLLDGAGLPSVATTLAELTAADRLAAGDVDGDGRTDLVVTRRAGAVQICFARDDYRCARPMPAPFTASAAAVADANGDGTTDLVISRGQTGGQVLLYAQ